MAALNRRKLKAKGCSYSVEFRLHGIRKTLMLGSTYTEAEAKEIQVYVGKLERLIMTKGEPDVRTQFWLDSMSDDLRDRFERAGLIEKSKKVTLAELFDRFLDHCEEERKRGNITETTIRTYVTVQKRFFRYFAGDENPNELKREDCEEWLRWVMSKGNNGKPYSEASRAGCVQRCGAVFRWAEENGYIRENPFKGIERGSFVNKSNRYFITAAEFRQMMDACHDQTLKTFLACLRYGGMRASEPMFLKWSDVLWDADDGQGRLWVHSPKTKRYHGKGDRLIPLYPELRAELEKQFEQAKPEAEGGTPYIIDKWRECTATAIRKQVVDLIHSAGLKQWPDLLQNMRRSRDIELSSNYPAHVAADWMGHSPTVAAKHYLFSTDADYKRASKPIPAAEEENAGISGNRPESSVRCA